jgi:hypothetical protein
MSQSKRFSHSFRPIVKLKGGKECRLKDHWSGVCRELAGIIDFLAEHDPTGERFVFAKAPALTARCKKFKDKTGYGQRAVEYALAEFRRCRIIRPATRVRDGIERKGFIVWPHDSLTLRQGERCFWDGFLPESAECCAAESAVYCAGQSAGSSAV